MAGAAKKQDFDAIYRQPNPLAFRKDIMESLSYVCDDFTRQEFDRLLLPLIPQLKQPCNVVDLLCCFGNTTMAIVNGMSVEEIHQNWSDEASCKTVARPRRFPCNITGVDISQSALDYTTSSGINDASICADMNTSAGVAQVLPAMKSADLLISTAALVYLTAETVDKVIREFASGEGTGYAIVNFLNPFNAEKTDEMKRILLKYLTFVGSRASRHRKLSEHEKKTFGAYGDWALLEIWVLQRGVGKPPGPVDTKAQDYYDSADAFNFYRTVWGSECLHVGIYDAETDQVELGPERIRLASVKAMEKLTGKVAPRQDMRIMDMGSGYGHTARSLAKKYRSHVSCVELSKKENELNRQLTEAEGLAHLVSCPSERSFTNTGEKSGTFDAILSEDSFLHAAGTQQRQKAIAECARLLKPGGVLAFTDIMQSATCNKDLSAVYERIDLTDLGSVSQYKQWAQENGLLLMDFEDLSHQLPIHYSAVRTVMMAKREAGELKGLISDDWLNKMADGLQEWVTQAEQKTLVWGYFRFCKPMLLRDGKDASAPRYRALPALPPTAIKAAIVSAAGRLGELDTRAGPGCLISMGKLSIVAHLLVQLHSAGIERVLVQCGYMGQKIEDSIRRTLPSEVYKKLEIQFMQLGNDCLHVNSLRQAKEFFKPDERFLICMANHIFDPTLIQKMACAPLQAGAEEAYALVETDFVGMVGVPATIYKVRLHRQDLQDVRAVQITTELMALDNADGVCAGLFACNYTVFDKVDALASGEAVYFTMADVLAGYVTSFPSSLHCMTTDKKVWFAAETKDTLAYAISNGLRDIGIISDDSKWLQDGAFDFEGKPIHTGPVGQAKWPGGSDWSSFSVERWRNAVYVTTKYFGELCEDTIKFIVEIAKQIKLRGESVSLVEVGCGTGEFVYPIADHFRVAIGVDFNANFINFCMSQMRGDKMRFVHGNAAELVSLMKQTAPAHIWTDTKIVACVGNTMGIIPVWLKPRVYQQMKELAGPKGVVIIVYWNANWFGDACQNFYHMNPQLCGPFGGESIDLDRTTLRTPEPVCYTSHWTSVEEARQILREHGMEEIIVEERGKGVLVAARVLPE